MKFYISGPMTDQPNNNFEAFFEAEKYLLNNGHIVLNPARNPEGLSYQEYMQLGMAMARISDCLYILPGHESSTGATAEIAYARSLGKALIYDPEAVICK